MIKKLLGTSKLITSTISSSKAKMTQKEHRKKMMQVANGNKRFTTFLTLTNMKNISLITDINFQRNLMNFFAL